MKLFQKKENHDAVETSTEAGESQETTAKTVWNWIYKLRGVFFSIPVLVGAIILAVTNGAKLPDQVQLCWPSLTDNVMDVQILEIGKGLAIFGPLLITAVCIGMIFCSKRMVYPGLISIVSLILPLFIYFSSVFPG